MQPDSKSDHIVLRPEELTSQVASDMIAALNAELTKQYPEEGANHFRLDTNEVADGRGAFLVAYSQGKPIGCGAVRRLDGDTSEIKRMYVDGSARGKGVGRQILQALESKARQLGTWRIVLETGERQTEAMALYEKEGFTRIPLFGEYIGSPLSVCMAKNLEGKT